MPPGEMSAFSQAIVSSALLTGVLALYLYRFAGSRWWLALSLGVCALDQFAKGVLLPSLRGRHLSLGHHAVGLVYFENHEQGFGGDFEHLLLVTGLCVLVLLALYRRLTRTSYHMSVLAQLGFALMIGGCLGILLDRISLGFVRDFIELGKGGDFVYNIADLSVFAALALLLVRGLRYLGDPANRRRLLSDEALT